jgi:hypothetical protein
MSENMTTPGEVDARVAEEVMGYTFHQNHSAACGGIRQVEARPPGGEVLLDDGVQVGHAARFGAWTIRSVPAYSTDPAADYSVLVKVRETWDSLRLTKFSRALETLWEIDCSSFSFIRYKPGDYSRAALAALAAKEPKP